MTTTYDPFDSAYFDEPDLRRELTRVYDLCHGCRLCFKFCPAFPTLFELIDRHDDQDAAKLSAAEQDRVVDECFNCKLCYVNCPYTPDRHEWAIDFPRLMLRAEQVRVAHGGRPRRAVRTDNVLGRTDLVGRLGSATAPLANRAIGRPGSSLRKVMERATGIASERLLPPFARVRFSTWFRDRARLRFVRRQGRVALFPTCMVEYHAPEVGRDLVKVFEHNGIECELPAGQVCCGAPWLHSGDLESFGTQARKNIAVLAGAVRGGAEIVVPQPTCSYVLKRDYPAYIGGADAALVAAHTFDAAEFLIRVHKGDGTSLDTDFSGRVPEAVTYHAPCHLRAQNIGLKSRELLKLTGAKVTVVAECAGIDGTWGYRAENFDASRKVAAKLRAAVEQGGDAVVAGDCALANGAIVQETGKQPLHPIQIVARAYELPED